MTAITTSCRCWARKEHVHCCWCCTSHDCGCWWERVVMVSFIHCYEDGHVLSTPLHLLQTRISSINNREKSITYTTKIHWKHDLIITLATKKHKNRRIQHFHVCLDSVPHFLVGLVHCWRDLQILFSAKTTSKLGLTVLFTHLKMILL